jgi:hypothetical protein
LAKSIHARPIIGQVVFLNLLQKVVGLGPIHSLDTIIKRWSVSQPMSFMYEICKLTISTSNHGGYIKAGPLRRRASSSSYQREEGRCLGIPKRCPKVKVDPHRQQMGGRWTR